MSIGKKILASIIFLAVIVLFIYGLYLLGGPPSARGEGGGLDSLSARTIITLVVWGGSAFITGFGLRDVVGRVAAARLRNRSKAAQGTGSH